MAGVLVACSVGSGSGGTDFDGGFGGGSAGTGASGVLAGAGGAAQAGAGGAGGSSGGMAGGPTNTGAVGGTSSGGSGATSDSGTTGGSTGIDSGVGDASLGGSGGTTDASTGYGDCCTAHGTPGCTDTNVQKCVCDIDATCCGIGWNANCVLKAFTYNCAACPDGGVTTGGGSGGGGPGGDCCVSHSTPGCGNASVQACVCAVDSYCCSYSWDSLCASEVTSEGCGAC
jgi:hypothetical protein